MPRGNEAVPAWPYPADDASERPLGGPREALDGGWRQRRRWRWSPLGTIVSVALGVVLGVGVAFGMLLFAGAQPAVLPPSMGAGTISVTVDDAFLTAALRDSLRQVPLGVSVHNVAAHCVPGDRILLAAEAETQVGPFTQLMPLSMTLQPGASQGHVTIHVLAAQVGGLTLPGTIDAQIEAAANARLGTLGHVAVAGAPPYEVRGMQTTYAHLTVVLGPATA